MQYRLQITTASGIEAVTKRELTELGYPLSPAENGRIRMTGSEADIARCNLLLRTANRVMIELTSFRTEDFDALFEGTRAFPWEDYLPADAKIYLYGKCVQSRLHALSACQSIVKKAICTRMCERLRRSSLPETGALYRIEISVLRDIVTLCLDTSGEGLHRRGYRATVGEAPLKETLAAALILLSVWRPDRPFADPFCGSGTLPIEAAMIGTNFPAGGRRDFDFLHWPNFDFSCFAAIKAQALEAADPGRELRISGFDLDPAQIALAMKHASQAGVAEHIHFQRRDMREFSSRFAHGVIVTNPPYGQRLGTDAEVRGLMRDFGRTVDALDEWSCYILSSLPGLPKAFGRPADRVRKLYNGRLECGFYQFLKSPPRRRERQP